MAMRKKDAFLIEAASYGNLVYARKLLALGADPNARRNDRCTALTQALYQGKSTCVELLAPLTDLSTRDIHGRDYLTLAAMSCDPGCLRTLAGATSLPLRATRCELLALDVLESSVAWRHRPAKDAVDCLLLLAEHRHPEDRAAQLAFLRSLLASPQAEGSSVRSPLSSVVDQLAERAELHDLVALGSAPARPSMRM